MPHHKLHFFNAVMLGRKWRRPHLIHLTIPSNDLALPLTPHHFSGRRPGARQRIPVFLKWWEKSWRVPHSWGAESANGEISNGDASMRGVPALQNKSSTTSVRREYTAITTIWSWHLRIEQTPWGTSPYDGREMWRKIILTEGNLSISMSISLFHSGRIKREFRKLNK